MKQFGNKIVLNDISLSLNEELTLGLLGPNGAGKTTFLNLFLNRMKKTSGNFIFKD